jgi:formate hydrogenlyase transcriptional activator
MATITGLGGDAIDTRLRIERDRLTLLLDVTHLLVSHLDLGELFHAVSGCLDRMIPHDYASISIFDQEPSRAVVRMVVVDGQRRPDLENRSIPISSDASTKFAVGEPVIFRIEDLVHRNPEVHQILGPLGMRWFCSIALHTARGAVGLLSVATRNVESFATEDVDLLNEVSRPIAIGVENGIAYDEIRRLKDDLVSERLVLDGEPQEDHGFTGIIGQSAPLRQLLQQVDTVAGTDATVLLTGETGTGKELVARAIHERSLRKQRAFVPVNCAAIPAALIESEMFGHERGAFTGAVTRRVGRFELAHGGTLFLDEIGELPLDVQPKLLRALQDHEFERVGATRTIHSDFRLIAATNRDLPEMVEAGEFRRDLFYRLSVFPIHLPPLRDRRADIPALVRHFAEKHAQRLNRRFSGIPSSTIETLSRWDWPGNIRELENLIERAIIVSGNGPLTVPAADLQPRGAALSRPAESRDKLAELEREAILAALRASGGIISGSDGAAARLGVKRTTLQSRIRKLGIRRQSF